MAAPNDITENNVPDLEQEAPLDPAAERVRRKLVRFMAINLGILFAALMAVALAFVYKTLRDSPQRAEPVISDTQLPLPMAEGELAIPPGAGVISHSVSETQLSLLLTLADGSNAIFIFDMTNGDVIGRFSLVGRDE